MLSPRFIKMLPALASFLMAAAMFVQLEAWAIADDASSFHTSVSDAVGAIPMRFKQWDGVDINVPPPAAKLLRPNAVFARRYQHTRDGLTASLVLVHCTDSRDMSGHYPPNCYPASGWMPIGVRAESSVLVNDRPCPVAIYRYQRTELGMTRTCTVYNFFILPRGLVTGMDDVRKANGDRQSRPFGAAQVQVILNADIEPDKRNEVVQELLEPVANLIDMIQIHRQKETP